MEGAKDKHMPMNNINNALSKISDLLNNKISVFDSTKTLLFSTESNDATKYANSYVLSDGFLLYSETPIISTEILGMINIIIEQYSQSLLEKDPLTELIGYDIDTTVLQPYHYDFINSCNGKIAIGVSYHGSNIDVVREIVESTFSSSSFHINDKFILFTEDDELDELCDGCIKNVQSEIFEEIKIFKLIEISDETSFKTMFDLLLDMEKISRDYKLFDKYIKGDNLLEYRIISSIDKDLEHDIYTKVFSNEALESFDEELQDTVNLFFKNNLNLTDTSKELYIHRNTLLYRIEKINKVTGYDLRKFEDSWLFKAAWMIYRKKHSRYN